MFNAPHSSRRRRQVEPATAAQLARIASYSQRGDDRQQAITMALVMYQRAGGEVSRGRAASVLDACSSGHYSGFSLMLMSHHGAGQERPS